MSKSKKILVIDDDKTFVQFLALFLTDNGYDVAKAHDGQEGLDKLREERPDLVLLDITMPQKSGVRFYRDLREDDELKSTPVIMVTGVTEDFKKFIHSRRQVSPPEGYLTKPVDKHQLLDTISKLLSSG